MALANERQGDGASNLSKEHQEDVATMNAAIDRMRAFTPADPYVLTIPQDVEPRYHHHYAIQARQWLENTPFDYREHESIQYQTFIYHEPGKEMYMLHSSRLPDAGANGDGDVKGKEKAGTGANTPNPGAKKKISLETYKKKLTGHTPEVTPGKELGQEVKKPAAKGVVDRLKEDEEVLAAVEEDVLLNVVKEKAPAVEAKKELKRKRESVSEKKAEQEASKVVYDTPQDVLEPPSKKLKPTSPPKQTASTIEHGGASPPSGKPIEHTGKTLASVKGEINADRLPPKLSPPPQLSEDENLPPKLSPIDSLPPLPSKFSPTLPANIAATLKAQGHLRSLSRSSDMPKDAVGRTLTPPPTKPGKKKSPAPRNGFRANSSSPAVPSDVEERGRPITSAPRNARLSDAESAEDSEVIAVSRKHKALPEQQSAEKRRSDDSGTVKSQQKDLKPDKPSLMVTLKFKKGARERLRSLLRTKPQPDKSLVYSSDSTRTTTTKSGGRRKSVVKGVAQRIGPSRTANGVKKSAAQQSLERKRSLPDESDSEDDNPAMKRKKTAADIPQTKKHDPSTPLRAGLPSPSSAQKPNSQLSPNNLRKDVLSVSMKRDLSTDSAMHTPNAASNSPPASTKDASYTAKGTTKPPSSQPSTKTPTQQAWEREHKRLEDVGRNAKRAISGQTPEAATVKAILALESVLAFMLAFVCADEAALTADPKRTPSTRPWKSLQQYIGFVKTHCEPFPVLQGVVCSLGIVFNAHAMELTSQHPSEGLLEQVMKTQSMMQRAAQDAESKLDIDVLQSTFPKTWAAREKGAVAQTKLQPGKSFTGPYKLPIGMQTSPLRAVRAGYAMLEEWMGMQDGLDYALTLKL